MRKNHWNSTSKKRQNAYKHGYKSGLELKVADALKEVNYPVNYETEKLKYTVPASNHTYTPDFILQKKNGEKMYIETKGRWTAADRKKFKFILKDNPKLDIRFVFQNPTQRLSKTSKTTYEAHAYKIGIKHVAKKMIPAEWLAECLQIDEIAEESNKKINFFS